MEFINEFLCDCMPLTVLGPGLLLGPFAIRPSQNGLKLEQFCGTVPRFAYKIRPVTKAESGVKLRTFGQVFQ